MKRFGDCRAEEIWSQLYEASETDMNEAPHCAIGVHTEGLESQSFDEVVENNRAWMLSLARRYLRDAALAEDCVQEALYRVHLNLDRFEARSSLNGWLRRITINCAIMILRRRKRHDDQSIEQPHFEQWLATDAVWSGWSMQEPKCSVQSFMRDETRAILRREICALPMKHREILELRDLKELSNKEVAAHLKISEGAAKVRLHRARSALRQSLTPVAEDLTF